MTRGSGCGHARASESVVGIAAGGRLAESSKIKLQHAENGTFLPLFFHIFLFRRGLCGATSQSQRQRQRTRAPTHGGTTLHGRARCSAERTRTRCSLSETLSVLAGAAHALCRHSTNRSVETRVHFSRELHRALNLDSGKVQPLTALSHRSRISAYPFAVTSKPLRLKPTRIMSRASLCTSLHSKCVEGTKNWPSV